MSNERYGDARKTNIEIVSQSYIYNIIIIWLFICITINVNRIFYKYIAILLVSE